MGFYRNSLAIPSEFQCWGLEAGWLVARTAGKRATCERGSLGACLGNAAAWQPGTLAHWHTGRQWGKQADNLAGRPAGRQAGRLAGVHAGWRAGRQAGRQAGSQAGFRQAGLAYQRPGELICVWIP